MIMQVTEMTRERNEVVALIMMVVNHHLIAAQNVNTAIDRGHLEGANLPGWLLEEISTIVSNEGCFAETIFFKICHNLFLWTSLIPLENVSDGMVVIAMICMLLYCAYCSSCVCVSAILVIRVQYDKLSNTTPDTCFSS